MPNLKVKLLIPKDPRRRRSPKASLKAKVARLSLQPRVVTSTLTMRPRLIQCIKMMIRLMNALMNLKKMIQKLI